MQLIEQACQHLTNGQAIAYPTETLWGLGVDALNQQALQNLYTIKQRPAEKAVSLLVADVQQAQYYAHISLKAEAFLKQIWPGPVTVVLPCLLPALKLETVGLRCSSHTFVQKLAATYKSPITSTSCNKSGQPPAHKAEDLTWLPKEVLVCRPPQPTLAAANQGAQNQTQHAQTSQNQGPAPKSQGSTVVLWHDKGLKILRHGDISPQKLHQIFEHI